MSHKCERLVIFSTKERRKIGRSVGIELLIKFAKAHLVAVLPIANQIRRSQMELSFDSSTRNLKRREPALEAAGHLPGNPTNRALVARHSCKNGESPDMRGHA